jgi:hypothetical protein
MFYKPYTRKPLEWSKSKYLIQVFGQDTEQKSDPDQNLYEKLKLNWYSQL